MSWHRTDNPCTLIALALVACEPKTSSMTEQEIEQVVEEWSADPPREPAPVESALRDPDGLPIPLPPMVVEPERLSDQFFVILQSSPAPGAMPESLSILAGHPELMAAVARASSSWFQGLMPCYEITIAGAFEHRRQATTLARRLEVLGVESYVKQAGRYVGRQELVESWCQADHAVETASCDGVHFVEVHGEKAWIALAQDPLITQRAAVDAPAPEPLGDLATWSSPLGVETIEPYSKGDKFRVVAPVSARSLDRCRIESFAAITRGQPHFGYLQQQPPPTEPGCGEPELFGQLSCTEPPAEPLLAIPAGRDEPILYTPLAPLRDIELEDDAKVLVARSSAFGPVFTDARARAEERSMPLQQLVTLRGFVAPERKVLLIVVTLQTGDGEVWCGADDVREELAGLYLWTKDGKIGEEILPFRALEGAEVLGILDIDSDGAPEMLQRRFPNELQLWRQGEELACTAPQAYCDCPC
jgi:hypothetical protein